MGGVFKTLYSISSKKKLDFSRAYLYLHARNLPSSTLVKELEKRYMFSSGTRESLIQRLKQKILYDKKMVLWAKRHNNI